MAKRTQAIMAEKKFTEPNGALRLLQAFAGQGPLCDCGCMGRSLVLCADDDHKGYALTKRCAESRGALDEYQAIADEIKGLTAGDKKRLTLPKWKEGSARQWGMDLHVLFRGLGAINNYQIRVSSVNEIEIYVPEAINTIPEEVPRRAARA